MVYEEACSCGYAIWSEESKRFVEAWLEAVYHLGPPSRDGCGITGQNAAKIDHR